MNATVIGWTLLVGLIAATIFAAAWIRLGHDIDSAVQEINASIDADRIAQQVKDYHCRTHGHAFCHPELHNGQRVWRCENCGDAVVSDPGWVDGGKR